MDSPMTIILVGNSKKEQTYLIQSVSCLILTRVCLLDGLDKSMDEVVILLFIKSFDIYFQKHI